MFTLVVCATTSAWAVDPVAVWDGDFTATQEGFKLNRSGNAISQDNSTITIDQTVGVKVDFTTAIGSTLTVLFRYSDLTLSSQRTLITSFANSQNENRTGVYLASKTVDEQFVGTPNGIWNTTNTYNTDATQKDVTSAKASGVMAFQYSSGGTSLYYIDNGSASVVYSCGTLKAGDDFTYSRVKGFTVGGERSRTSADLFAAATGMKITGIAIFEGNFTTSDMAAYIWPSEIEYISVDENTSVSALNGLIADFSTGIKKVVIDVDSGVTIDVNEAFDSSVLTDIVSEGTVTLSADSQPSASHFTNVDFSGVQGALLRSWLTPGVVGFNFNANGGCNNMGNTDGAADTALALEIGTWYKDAYSATSSSTAMFSDGLSLLSWKANNVHAETADLTSGTFIQGYLDDGGNVIISLTGVPYETYDIIIYCSTDDSSKSFKAKRVNGTIYTWDSTAGETTTTDSETTTWGLASAAAGKAVYGANTLRINGLSGPLSIKGGTNGNNARGCISAIQIMPAGTSTAPEMTVGTAGQTTQANWTDALWNVATAPTSGNVIIKVSGDVELTVDETVALSAITVMGAGSLKLIPDQQNSVTLIASSISSAVPLIFANDGIGIDTISASVTYLYKTTSIASSSYGNTYTAGVGEQGSPVTISHSGGSVTLQGATYYLGESYNATATTVTFDDATAVYSSNFGVGMATYSVEGSSSISAQRLILSQGANSRTAAMTVKDTASINVTGTSDVDSNQASIMFGHFNGPSTFTIQDSATFTAASQVLVGKTSNNHTINIDGGTFTAKGIKTAANASGTNTLNLNGGLLVLGDVGITSYSPSKTIGVNVLDDSEIRASAATLPITQSLTVSEDATLSFTKDSGIVATAVSLTGAVSGSGNISVGPGVTLNLGTNRPAGVISVDEGGVLTVVMINKGDVPVLKVSSKPSTVILYDTDGTTVLDDATVDYDNVAGTIVVKPPMPRWTTQSNSGSFDTVANWSTGSVPTSGDAVIELSQDTTISVSETYTLSSLIITGTGTATLSGTGTITADTVYVVNGATLTQDGHINATSISLDSGTVLKLNGVTESAAISGAGRVETYGSVTFNANNTFTGGLTVKSGSTARTIKTGIGGQGYGKNNYGQAIANLSRIVVEDGGSLDLANTTDSCYAITIAGKGVKENGVYKGALYNSGSEIGSGSRQTASLTLSADAMVRAEGSRNGWGLVNSSHEATVLALNGHTLTVSGLGYFPIVNANTASGTTTTGTLVLDGVTLGLVSTGSDFTGVNIVAKGCATLNMSVVPTAIGSLTLKPTASGTTASAWNLPAGLVPAVDASNIDPSGLSYGANLTLFTAPDETELTDANISVIAGSRYTTAISGNTVTATVKAGCPTNFMHYDFNAENSIASDSTYNIGNLNPDSVKTGGGKAGTFNSAYKPHYDSNTASKSPFYAGEMTVTTLLKPREASNTIIWNIGSTEHDGKTGIALIAENSSTLTLVSWVGGGAGSNVVSVTGIDVLNKWHFVTVVANANGTTLYVDNQHASVDTCLPYGINARGQFGSIHGSAKSYSAVASDGFLLDDWRVYDAALTASEIETIRDDLVYVEITVPTVPNTTVTVTSGTLVDVDNGVYAVPYGSAVVVTYAAASGCRISGTTTYNIASATEDETITVDANLHSDPLVARITGSEIDYTLQEAVTASSAGDTIILFANCNETAVDTTGKDFIFDENNCVFSGTWTGSGRIVLNSAPSATTWSSVRFVADGWTGECVINWEITSGELNINSYGITGSTVVLGAPMGVDAYVTVNGSFLPRLRLDAKMSIMNGTSDQTATFAEVTGSGDLYIYKFYAGTQTQKISNLTDYAGKLETNGAQQFEILNIKTTQTPIFGEVLVRTANTCTFKNFDEITLNSESVKLALLTRNGVRGIYMVAASRTVDASTVYYATIEDAALAALSAGETSFNIVNTNAGTELEGWDYADGTFTRNDIVAYNVTTTASYTSLEEALSSAEAGQTIRLVCANDEDIVLPSNVTLDCDYYAYTGTLGGAGKVLSKTPNSKPEAFLTEGDDKWVGTFVCDWDPAGDSNYIEIKSYGNINSVVELTGMTAGYLKGDGGGHPNVTTTVKLSGDVTISNGDGSNTQWTGNLMTIARLTGSGNLNLPKESGYSYINYKITSIDASYGGQISVGGNGQLEVGAVDFDSELSVPTSGGSCIIPISKTNRAAVRTLPVDLTVGNVSTGKKLLFDTLDETSGLYLAVASVTVNAVTSYHTSLAAAKTTAGNDPATITLLANVSEDVALAHGQVLDTGTTSYSGTVSAADPSAKIIEDGTTYKVRYGTIFSVW